MPKPFHSRHKIVVSTSKDNYATNEIFKKCSSKCSSGCVGGSFHQQTKWFFTIHFLWLKNQKQSCFLLEKNVFLEYSYAHVEGNFDTARKRTKIQDSSTQTLKMIIQTTSFLKEIVSWKNVSCHVDCMFGNPADKEIAKKPKSFLLEKKWEYEKLLRHFLHQKVPVDM